MHMEMQMETPEKKKETRCSECRFWSERLAKSIGGGPMQAYCLVEGGPFSGRYTTGSQGCDKGKANQHGAIDDPYSDFEEVARLYAEDDALDEFSAALSATQEQQS